MPDTSQPVATDACGFVLAGGRSSRMGRDKAMVCLGGRPLLAIAQELLRSAGLPAHIAGRRHPIESGVTGPDIAIPDIAKADIAMQDIATADIAKPDIATADIAKPDIATADIAKQDIATEDIAIHDLIPNSGPLGGIHAALSASSARWNLFLPVDMPLVPSSLLQCLVQRARLTGCPITAVHLGGRLQPLPVVLDRAVLPLVMQQLEQGQRTCRIAWQSIAQAFSSSSGVPALDAPAVETLKTLGHCQSPHGLPPASWFQSANTPEDLAWLERAAAPRA